MARLSSSFQNKKSRKNWTLFCFNVVNQSSKPTRHALNNQIRYWKRKLNQYAQTEKSEIETRLSSMSIGEWMRDLFYFLQRVDRLMDRSVDRYRRLNELWLFSKVDWDWEWLKEARKETKIWGTPNVLKKMSFWSSQNIRGPIGGPCIFVDWFEKEIVFVRKRSMYRDGDDETEKRSVHLERYRLFIGKE